MVVCVLTLDFPPDCANAKFIAGRADLQSKRRQRHILFILRAAGCDRADDFAIDFDWKAARHVGEIGPSARTC